MESNGQSSHTSSDDDIDHNDIDHDVDDEKYYGLSSEEISLRINTFQHLCSGNKLNTNNAFDIDMIEYFASWIERKKSAKTEDYDSFQEVSDYLDVSGKVYSLRVDNVSESTGKLAEKFRTINLRKSILDPIDENEPLRLLKSKRPKIMLTTSEKLKAKTDGIDYFADPTINQANPIFEWEELFETGHPYNYMTSVFFNYNLKEGKQKALEELSKNDENNSFSISDLKNKLNKGVLCSKFCNFDGNFDAEESNNAEEFQIEGIENHFDPEFNDFNDNEQPEECDPNSDDNHSATVDNILDCVDNVNRDYSFFNPLLLAKWKRQGKGPQAWKTRAMVKSLKSCNPNEREQILSMPNDLDDIDELTEQTPLKPKTTKRTKKGENEVKIAWKSIEEIEEMLLPKVKKQEILMPKTLRKWVPHIHIGINRITVDTKIMFDLLKYCKIVPDWWTPEDNMSENSSNPSPNYQNADGCFDEAYYLNEIERNEELEEDARLNEFVEELSILNDRKEFASGKDDVLKEFKTEVKMDIGDLKKEISKIIDQECTEFDSEHGMCGKLLYSNLLRKLNVQSQDGPSVAVVFVGLLHLCNELGLKLHQEPGTINDIQELSIFKPRKTE